MTALGRDRGAVASPMCSNDLASTRRLERYGQVSARTNSPILMFLLYGRRINISWRYRRSSSVHIAFINIAMHIPTVIVPFPLLDTASSRGYSYFVSLSPLHHPQSHLISINCNHISSLFIPLFIPPYRSLPFSSTFSASPALSTPSSSSSSFP